MIITGKLIACKREAKEFEKGRKTDEKLFISLADAKVTEEQLEELRNAFKDAGKKFTPSWVKEFEGYVNVATQYELPFRDINKVEYSSIEAAISNGLKWHGATVKISLNIKEGAIYPNAMIFLTEGESFNSFAEFDAEED